MVQMSLTGDFESFEYLVLRAGSSTSEATDVFWKHQVHLHGHCGFTPQGLTDQLIRFSMCSITT